MSGSFKIEIPLAVFTRMVRGVAHEESSSACQSGLGRGLSISVPKEDKEALERIAEGKRVSLAWVIRDAVLMYLMEKIRMDEQ